MTDEIPPYIPPEVAERLASPSGPKGFSFEPANVEEMTEAHWEAILENPGRAFHHAIAARNKRLKRPCFRLSNPELLLWAGRHRRSCGACGNTKMHGDPRRGFCVPINSMVSLTFPVLCKFFKPA